MRLGREERGFVLVVVLGLVAVVSILAAVFLSQLQNERVLAQGFDERARAELALEGAIELALGTMRDLWTRYPDAATAWEELPGGGITGFYYRTGSSPAVWVRPLVSGAQAVPLGQSRTAFRLVDATEPFEAAVNSVDINQAAGSTDPYGWIGSPPGGRRPVRVPWVELTDPDSGKVVARYAYWIEDESGKVNLNRASAMLRGGDSPGASPDEIPLQGILGACGVPEVEREALAKEIVRQRETMPGHRFPGVVRMEGLNPHLARYYLTPFSKSLNLTRSGAKRWNVNSQNWNTVNATEIRNQLDRIIAVVRHGSPDFGQRFYRLNASPDSKPVSAEHAGIYLQKVAVNLRDYLAPAGLPPTIVRADRTVWIGARPQHGIELAAGMNIGPNPVWAVGKKNLPYLQEVAMRVTLRKFDPVVSRGAAAVEYEFDYDYYLEFWNMTARDIRVDEGDLGANPAILIYDQPAFRTSSATHQGTEIPEGRPFEIPLKGIVFPAGKATVITTDPEPNMALLSGGNPANIRVVAVPEEVRRYRGITFYNASGKFRVELVPRSSTSTDYQTKMLLRNVLGVLDSVSFLPLARGTASGANALQIHNDGAGDPKADLIHGTDREQYLVRGGSLMGTRVASQTGDPRTTNEQLTLVVYGNGDEQSRYYNSGLDNVGGNGAFNVPAQSSLGLPNYHFVNPLLWPDAFAWSSDGVDTPVYVANAPMKSVGELGHLFDPARPLGPSGEIAYSRGGGRSFTLGQPDPLIDARPEAPSREWAAWRLADLFSTHDAVAVEGTVNVNLLLRDQGAAIRALLEGFVFTTGPEADPGVAGQLLPETVRETLVAAIRERLMNIGTLGPFMERGELSEVMGPVVSAIGARYDRGREELFRRMVELITTRGSVFTVYAMGQSVTETSSGRKVYGPKCRRKVTFELVPEWDPPLDDQFDPSDAAAVASRFRPPDRYRVQVLAVAP